MSFLLRSKAFLCFSVPVVGVFAFDYIRKKANIWVTPYELPADLKKYVIVVTGADKGIGKATVEALAPTGARVIMACRDLQHCREVRRPIVIGSKNRQVVCRQCDLSSFESIKNFVARILKEEPRIDVLINNAGIKYVNPRKQTRENIEMQLGVNFLGHHMLTNLLLDKMKECAPARIVNVVGKAYRKGEVDFSDLNGDKKYDREKAYNQSKLALLLATKELSKQLDPKLVTVNAVDPGYTYTEIERHTEPFIKYFRKPFYYITRREPRQGAFPVLYAAFSYDLTETTGKFISNQLKLEELSEKEDDPILQRKVWLTANKWTRITQAYEDVKNLISNLPESDQEKMAKL